MTVVVLLAVTVATAALAGLSVALIARDGRGTVSGCRPGGLRHVRRTRLAWLGAWCLSACLPWAGILVACGDVRRVVEWDILLGGFSRS